MTTLTISRQFGSGGDEIASRVCEILGYKEFDKHLISRAAQEAGLSENEITEFSEENHKIRSFLDRLFGREQPIAKSSVWKENLWGSGVLADMPLTEEMAVVLVQKAVLNAFQVGNLVIVGRGGQVILKDQPNAIHVRIEAPIEDRIQRVKQQMKKAKEDFHADIDIRREAQDWIVQKDAASYDYLKRFYQVDWSDPLLYHIVLNTGKLSIEEAAQAIVNLVHTIQPEPEPVKRTILAR